MWTDDEFVWHVAGNRYRHCWSASQEEHLLYWLSVLISVHWLFQLCCKCYGLFPCGYWCQSRWVIWWIRKGRCSVGNFPWLAALLWVLSSVLLLLDGDRNVVQPVVLVWLSSITPHNTWMEMYAGCIACCPWSVTFEYAPHALLRLEKDATCPIQVGKRWDRQMNRHQTNASCLQLDAASIINVCMCDSSFSDV